MLYQKRRIYIVSLDSMANQLPPPPPGLASSKTNSPPQTIRTLKRTLHKTVELDVIDQMSPQRKIRRFELVSKSCHIIHHTQHQTDSTLKRQSKHIFASSKANITKRQLPKMGSMSVEDAERSITERRQKELAILGLFWTLAAAQALGMRSSTSELKSAILDGIGGGKCRNFIG